VGSSLALLRPVGKITGVSFADEMVRLQGAKGIGRGMIGAAAQSGKQLTNICRLFRINSQYICSGIEVKKGKCLLGSYAVAPL
jgi:hypothetical protein